MQTNVHSNIPAGVFAKRLTEGKNYMAFDAVEDYADLSRIGIGGIDKIIDGGYGMDANPITGLQTTASITTPVQFLQNWLPGLVKVITAARKIDELTGIMTAGEWFQEQIVQQVVEPAGSAVPYQDMTNVPYADWNQNFVTREVVRFELGLRVGRLEEARAGAVRVNSGQEKREYCAVNLDVTRNEVGFFGYNSGNNNTYGFLNDPNLPGYVTVAASGSGSSTLWADKTFLEIVQDLLVAFAALQNQTLDNVNPEDTETVLALATVDYQYLNTVSDFGISVKDWLKSNYPKCRIVSAPQLNGANGGANVFYIYAERIADNSTDGGQTFVQVVPSRFQVLGVQPNTKGYEEDYLMASAGIMTKRPYLVVRYSGI
ncbi:MAG: DUF2184 domain-containing protein [Patescibacteria group bacterium]|nr:DUF2184 domain-containing protein [Patescibacteria group bacterium]